MSILIKGIPMPRDCWECGVQINPLCATKGLFDFETRGKRPDNCPLAEAPRWIPVTEKLPEERINPNTRDFEYVQCVTIWGDVRPFKYGTPIGQKEAHFWNGAGYVDAYVTHWMPLPEPPKGES